MQLNNQIHARGSRSDLIGKVATAIIVLLVALAFGVVSGVAAETGLWVVVLVGFFAALFWGLTRLNL